MLPACQAAHPGRDKLADAPLAARLHAADARYGARIFQVCAACHNDGLGAGDRDGPNLWGVVGKPVGRNSASYGYTAALQSVGGVWTCERLDRWLADPQRFAPGTHMTFEGLSNGLDRADVIAYLAQHGSAASGGRPCS
jgi:cytochrome c